MSTELTAGAGFAYEDGVAAIYLAAILAEGAPLGLPDALCERVSFQRGANGHQLDDLVVEARRRDGETVRLDLQITRSIALTAGNAKFADIVLRAWQTIGSDEFSTGIDRVGAAVGTVGTTAARDMEFVCEAARASVDAVDFAKRLATWSAPRKQQVETIRRLIGANANLPEAWLLLRHFVLLQVSVDGDGARDAHHAIEILRQRTTEADALWPRLITIAQSAKATGGGLDSARIEERLRGSIALSPSRTLQGDIALVETLGDAARDSIRRDIDGHHLLRPAALNQILAAMGSARLVQLHGRPGSGKSVQLRDLAEQLHDEGRPILFLKADRLTETGWAGLRSPLKLEARSAEEVLRGLSLRGIPAVLIDGIDRVQPIHRALVIEIVNALIEGAAGERWSLVTTVRTGSLQDLANWFPLQRFQTRKDVEIKPLDDDEARALADARPGLRNFLFGAPALREIARRPFFLARLASLPSGPADQIATEVDLAAQWWRHGGHDAEGETMRRRRAALLFLARSGARTLGRGVPASGVDANALDGLVRDEVVVERDRGLRVSFSHDIFFEWAFFHVLLEAQDQLAPLRDAGEPPALGRSVELLSQEMLTREPERWRMMLAEFEREQVRSQWRRCWLLGPFQTRLRPEDAAILGKVVLADEGRRLERVLTWSRATRTQANPVVLAQPVTTEEEAFRNAEVADLIPWPEDFLTWRQLCEWLCSLADRIPPSLWLDVILVFEVWQIVGRDVENPVSKKLLSVVRGWLGALEDHYHPEERSGFPGPFPGLGWKVDSTLIPQARRLLLGGAIGNPKAVEAYILRLGERHSLHDKALEDVIMCSPRLSVALPQAFVDFVLKAVLDPLPKEELEQRRKEYEAELKAVRDGVHGRSSLLSQGFSSIDDFRLDELSIGEGRQQFYPAHPGREPFKSLFESAPKEAIRLVRTIGNHAIDAWRELHEIQNKRRGTPIPIILSFPWGEECFWGGAREYGMFRGTFSPHALTSGLMALEAWGFQQIDAGTSVEDLLARVIPGQRNVALLGIAVSWIMYKPAASQTVLPIASHPRVWNSDIRRLVQIDMTDLYPSEIGMFNQGADVIDALRAHNRRPHRRNDVRGLTPLYLFGSDGSLKASFAAALARFPDNLPFEIEEERSSPANVDELMRVAAAQASMARAEDYRFEAVPSQDGMVAIHPPSVDTPHAKAAAEQMQQMNRESGAFMLVTDLLENKTIKEGRPTRADALLTAKALWQGRKSNKELIEMQDGTSVGMAAVVLRERHCFDESDVAWAIDVVKTTLKEPWPDDDMVPGTILPWHPLRMASAALSGVALSTGTEAPWARRELLRLLAHPLDAVSHPAFKAALEVGDRNPRFGMIALRLLLDLHVRDDPLWPRMEAGERATAHGRRIDDALDHAYDLLDRPSAKVEPPDLPHAWKRIMVDDGDRKVARFMEPDRWLEVRELYSDIKAINSAAWLADERREFLLQIAGRLTQWTVERCEPDRRGGGREDVDRSQSDLELLWGLAEWLGVLASHLPQTIARKRFVNQLLTAPGEAGLEIVARFTDMLVCAGVFDAPSICEGTLEILTSCAARLPAARQWRDRDHFPDGTDTMCRALLFMSVENAGGATRFANGNYAEVELILPIVDQVLQRVGAHPQVTSHWLTLVERARRHYDGEAFLRQVETLIAAKHPLAWRGRRIPSRLANLIRYFAEEQRFADDRRRAVMAVLDTLIDEGDRRAAAILQSEVFRMLERTALNTVA
jgi:hypothetical protein